MQVLPLLERLSYQRNVQQVQVVQWGRSEPGVVCGVLQKDRLLDQQAVARDGQLLAAD